MLDISRYGTVLSAKYVQFTLYRAGIALVQLQMVLVRCTELFELHDVN